MLKEREPLDIQRWYSMLGAACVKHRPVDGLIMIPCLTSPGLRLRELNQKARRRYPEENGVYISVHI